MVIVGGITRSLCCLEVFPHKILIGYYKENYSKFCRLHLNLVAKVNFFSNETDQNCVLSDRLQQKEHSISRVIFLPKTYNLNLIMRKHQTNPNILQDRRTFYKIARLWISRSWWSKKDRRLFQEKETKKTWQLSVSCDSNLDPIAVKTIIGTIGEI